MKLAVVHYMPLEFYPPITNLLDVLSNESSSIKVWSTVNLKHRKTYRNKRLQNIHRSPFPKEKEHTILRLFKYLVFNWACFWGLVWYNPKTILYYESYSAFPIYWYLKLFGKGKRLLIHYHEYESSENYANGMRLVKYYHKLEQRYLYRKAIWISQTNEDRLKLFHRDEPYIKTKQLMVMPNYPPAKWSYQAKLVASKKSDIIKTVYVGSLSLKDTYIKSYCDWLILQEGQITLDIYAYNLHEETRNYLEQHTSPYIRFFANGISYEDLPKVLPDYDIGLILYKGNTPNYIYNAPNKLFEYMACGLEVWVPHVMKGCQPYLNRATRPVVRTVDYTNLNDTLLAAYQSHLDLPFVPAAYSCNVALQPLIKALKQA